MNSLAKCINQKSNQSDSLIIKYVTIALCQEMDHYLNNVYDYDVNHKDYKDNSHIDVAVYDADDQQSLFMLKLTYDDYKIDLSDMGEFLAPKEIKNASGDMTKVMLVNSSVESICDAMFDIFEKHYNSDSISLMRDDSQINPYCLVSTSGVISINLAFSFSHADEDDHQISLDI